MRRLSEDSVIAYVIDGVPRYCHNLVGLRNFIVSGTTTLPAGMHQVRMEFAVNGPGLGVSGTASLYVDGEPAGSGRVDQTVPLIYSGDETTEVGCDLGTPVSNDYASTGNEFTGRVRWVQIDVDDLAEDHLVHAEDRLRIIMVKQ
jgi:hypothetical protein